MDPFWCITLSVFAVSKFWKHQRIKRADKKIRDEKIEKIKQKEVIEKYSAMFGEPMTKEEQEAADMQKDIERKREKDIAELRKQGFDEELITTIIPTINNGQ